jgi:hypothetical protein
MLAGRPDAKREWFAEVIEAVFQKIRSIVMPPVAMSHIQAATVPPGRVTRAISRTPRSGSDMKPITSDDTAASHSPVRPRQVFGHTHTNVGLGMALRARRRELLRRIPPWPQRASVAVSLTFDVAAESGFLSEGAEYAARLTTLSEAAFGPARGVGRILELLSELALPATFYVPGDTAERHTATVEQIVVADRRHVTYTMHPEIIGRGHRIAMLRRFLETIRDHANIWFASHGEICDYLTKP